MMKLKPRKRIDPSKVKKAEGEPIPAYCAFCAAKIPRAAKVPGPSNARAGRCLCSAVFVADSTGKLGGEAIVEGLSLLTDGNLKRAMALREGSDYQCKVMAYREASHQVVPDEDPNRYGAGRMFFFRRASEDTEGGNG